MYFAGAFSILTAYYRKIEIKGKNKRARAEDNIVGGR